MKKCYHFIAILPALFLMSCGHTEGTGQTDQLAIRVRYETNRSWNACQRYARGTDVLPPIDAFSTLVVTGLTSEADKITGYVADSVHFGKDMSVKVFEANIQILGGLVSMYQLSGDEMILEKARDFGDRLMSAFQSPTGIPYYWVNLKTGEVKGSRVNVAEAGTYLLEMGMLSYFTGDQKYYKAAKRSSQAIFERRSEIGLVGEVIDVETGQWLDPSSHICEGIDSYYEYLFKGWLLFGDPDLKAMWDESIRAVLNYLPEQQGGRTWYGRVDMQTGNRVSREVTMRDAFMPGLLALSGHLEEAADLLSSWDWLLQRNGSMPMVYDYGSDSTFNPGYDLNPEIIESAWYLWELTGDPQYKGMIEHYFSDLMEHFATQEAFTTCRNVNTLKYIYLAFADQDMYSPETVVFSTQAQPFLKAALEPEIIRRNLGI